MIEHFEIHDAYGGEKNIRDLCAKIQSFVQVKMTTPVSLDGIEVIIREHSENVLRECEQQAIHNPPKKKPRMVGRKNQDSVSRGDRHDPILIPRPGHLTIDSAIDVRTQSMVDHIPVQPKPIETDTAPMEPLAALPGQVAVLGRNVHLNSSVSPYRRQHQVVETRQPLPCPAGFPWPQEEAGYSHSTPVVPGMELGQPAPLAAPAHPGTYNGHIGMAGQHPIDAGMMTENRIPKVPDEYQYAGSYPPLHAVPGNPFLQHATFTQFPTTGHAMTASPGPLKGSVPVTSQAAVAPNQMHGMYMPVAPSPQHMMLMRTVGAWPHAMNGDFVGYERPVPMNQTIRNLDDKTYYIPWEENMF